MEIVNYNPVDREGATCGIAVVGLLVEGENGAGISSGDAGLEGIFEGKEVREGKVTIGLDKNSGPEGV